MRFAVAPVLAALLLAAPAVADEGASYYRAELSAPAPDAKVIAGGVLWFCKKATCTAAKGTSRPAVMCKRLAQATSPVVSFSAGGEQLDAGDLKRCNG